MKKSNNGENAGRKPRCASATCYAPILVMPIGTDPATVAEARSHGYLPVLSDDPSKVVTIIGSTRANGDMMMASIAALASGHYQTADARSQFVVELHKRMVKAEGA
jgi:hypothetical protein